MRSTKNKLQFTFGAVIGVLMSAVLALAAVYLQLTMSTLNNMVSIQTVETPVGIFVRADDPAVSVDDAKHYTFGVLTNMDTENTEETVKELEKRYGMMLDTVGYDGLMEIMDGLLNGETDAMILNIAYLEVFEGFEGYEIKYQWQCDKGEGFENIENANEATYVFEASVETLGYDWRLAVYYR